MPDSSEVVGVLLAGGRARRMGGGDKCLALLDGRPLLAHLIERLGPQVDALAVSANGDPTRLARFGLPVVADTIPGFAGPLAGILAGMQWARVHRPSADRIASAAADTPFLPSDLVARLGAAAGIDGVAIARCEGRLHCVFGVFPLRLADDLERHLRTGGSRKVEDWLHRVTFAAVDFDRPRDGAPSPFFNVNTADDLAEAGAWLEHASRLPAGHG